MTDASRTDSSCIFCGIVDGRLPASVLYEDRDWLAVMDIHPIRTGHVLIVPRHHVARLSGLPPESRQSLFNLADRVLGAQEASGHARGGGNLLLNDGVAANQHIPHLHLHCIPRGPGDTVGFGTRLLARTFGLFGAKTARARLDAIAAELTRHLQVDAVR